MLCSLTFHFALLLDRRRQMDYGYFNQFLDRPVVENWWGTRTGKFLVYLQRRRCT